MAASKRKIQTDKALGQRQCHSSASISQPQANRRRRRSTRFHSTLILTGSWLLIIRLLLCSTGINCSLPCVACARGASASRDFYSATLNITTPCDGTVTEYSSPLNVTSRWVHKSRPFFGDAFRPSSPHFTLTVAGAALRLNIPIACAPSASGRAQTSCSPDCATRRPCLPAFILIHRDYFAICQNFKNHRRHTAQIISRQQRCRQD